MKRRPAFYPAKLNPTLTRSLQKIAPWLIRWRYQLELVLSTEPNVPLETLRNAPCLLLCNHPTFNDPMVMFLFSSVVQRSFYYLAAYERFSGLAGWLFQQIGAYSIRRGLADRDSVAYTLKLLAQPDCKLVIFPEGGCSFQNDTVMPFRPGALQMGLQALSKQAKQGNHPDFYVVPLSLKYRYTGQMRPLIERTLRRLEQAVGVSHQGSFYDRLRVIAAIVLQQFEQEYGVTPAEADWNQRVHTLKTHILQQCEQRLNLKPAPEEPNRERVYRIQHAIENRYTATVEGSNGVSMNGPEEWEEMRKSLARVLNFDAIYDGYVAEKPTPERFLDTLVRLERSIFNIDQPPPKGPQQAFLRVGQPINLQDYVQDYEKNRAAIVKNLTQQLQHRVQKNLDILSDATARDISW